MLISIFQDGVVRQGRGLEPCRFYKTRFSRSGPNETRGYAIV